MIRHDRNAVGIHKKHEWGFRRLGALIFVLAVAAAFSLGIFSEWDWEPQARSAILMEAHTGEVLFERNADEALPPASVTKVMTLLLVMEAVDSGKISMSDQVQISEHAASMGGSQIFLEVGETMTVEELVKSVVVASANDAAVALAEFTEGSEAAFVDRMNERAAQLGMKNTHFENTNGLDDNVTNHVTSARDIAIMSAELMRHPDIFRFTTIWQDTVRNGAFTLTNTNRLIRFYRGATGLKTGSTSKAGYCISATAERDGVSLIAVVMGSPTRDVRNAVAKQMLDYGFSRVSYYRDAGCEVGSIPVRGSCEKNVTLISSDFGVLLEKGESGKVERIVEMPESVSAPVHTGDVLGRVLYRVGDREVGTVELTAGNDVERIGFGQLLFRIFRAFAIS